MSALLSIRSVSKHFGGLTAVAELSFEVEQGGIVGLIGPNGAGKTTVFNLITGQLPPSDGEMYFKGASIARVPPHQRVRMGMVRTFQSTVLYNDSTVLENVVRGFAGRESQGFLGSIMGLATIARDEALLRRRALELLDVVELADSRDETARSLPYGHQRALGVAIGLATEPELIMLDEPVAGMNPGETAQMARLIERINEQGTTILVVEHDMSFVMSLCRRVVVINNGRKIAEGEPSAIQRDPEVVAAYLGEQDDDDA